MNRKMCARKTLLAALVVLIGAAPIVAQSAPSWADLQPGPFVPGFATIERYDFSRHARPKTDYFGNPREGETARPIQVCIWYPAAELEDPFPMGYGEYNFPAPVDDGFVAFLAEAQNRELRVLLGSLGGNRGMLQDALNVRMTAVRDAPHAEGKFPLIVYHTDLQNGIGENAALCEYLASHGFVVATTHAMGTGQLMVETTTRDIESMIADKATALGIMLQQAYVDSDRVGLLGFAHGGITALLHQMRSTNIRAVATLEGAFIYEARHELTLGDPFFSVHDATVPLLELHGADQPGRDFSLLDSLRYCPRYSATLTRLSGRDFTNYGILTSSVLPATDSTRPSVATQLSGYAMMCHYVRNFFAGFLADDETALAFLDNPVSSPDLTTDDVTTTFMAAQWLPPSRGELIEVLRDYGVDTALSLNQRYLDEGGSAPLFDEATFNAIGYQFMRVGQLEDARKVLKANCDSYPQSANTWDSYADCCLALGDQTEAVICYRKVLEVLPADTVTNQQTMDAIRANATQFLQNIEQEDSTGLQQQTEE